MLARRADAEHFAPQYRCPLSHRLQITVTARQAAQQ